MKSWKKPLTKMPIYKDSQVCKVKISRRSSIADADSDAFLTLSRLTEGDKRNTSFNCPLPWTMIA